MELLLPFLGSWVFPPGDPFTLTGEEGLGAGGTRGSRGGAGQLTSSDSVTITTSPWNEFTMYLMTESWGKSER
jgi:hypothetical protein